MLETAEAQETAKREPVSVRMLSDLWRWARHEAIERDCSAADIVEQALQSYRVAAESGKGKSKAKS